MNHVIEELLRPILKSFISDSLELLFLKLARRLEPKMAGRGAKVALGGVLALATIASIVVVTALVGV